MVCFRAAEGRAWSVHLKCVQKAFYLLWPSSYVEPQCLPRDLLRLRADACHSEGASPEETGLLSHQLLLHSLFLISQGAPRGCCLDCQHSISSSFYIVFNSHMLSLSSMLILESIKALSLFSFLS